MGRTMGTGVCRLLKVQSIMSRNPSQLRQMLGAGVAAFLAWDAPAQELAAPAVDAQNAAAAYELSAGARWSDNYARTPIANAGAMGTVGAVLDAYRKTGRLQFDAKANLDYVHYFSGNSKGEVLGYFDGAATYQLLPQSLNWVMEERFGQVTTDYFQAPTPQNRQYLNVFNTGPDFRLRLADALDLRVSGRYGRDDYQTSPYSARHLKAEAALERRPSEVALLSLGGGHERVDYLEDLAKPGNFSVNRYFASYRLQGARSSIDLEGGYAESQGGLAQLGGAIGHLVLERHIGVASSVHMLARRDLATVSEGSRANDYLPGAGGFTPAAIVTGSLYFAESAEVGYTWQRPRTRFDATVRLAKETDHHDVRPDRDLKVAGAKLTHRLTPLAEAILYASWTRDLLHDAQYPGLPVGDFISTETGYGATFRMRLSSDIVTSFDLAHTQRIAAIGQYRENAVWLRLAYAPRPTTTPAR